MMAEGNWMFAEANRDRTKHPQPFKLEEFMPGMATATKHSQTPEEMGKVMAQMARDTNSGGRA